MRTPLFSLSSITLLSACATTADAPINITNEITNEVTVESDCCGCEDDCNDCDDDPCGDDDPCADDDTGEPGGDTGEPGEMVSFEEFDRATLELEVNQVDVAFLIDTTGSMSGTANAMADEFNDIVDELDFSIPSAAYGYATYRDHPHGSFASPGDRPFVLAQQITMDTIPVQDELDATVTGGGGDTAESGIEAIYQALTGSGYDQNGNGTFDSDADVMPFSLASDAVFAGSAGEAQNTTVVGGGTIGGMGFRDGSLPVIVYATDAPLRDPDAGMPTPPDATFAAGSTDVTNEAATLGARLIGVATQETPLAQMEDLAVSTNSLYDGAGDGTADDPLVFLWTGSSADFRSTVVDAIEGMLDNVTFATVTAQVQGNTYGFTTSISPASYANVTVGSTAATLDFDVSIAGSVPASTIDQSFPLTLEIYGDGTTLLGTQDITVTVPASL